MTWIERYGPLLAIFHAGPVFMGLDFALVAWSGGSPITPELYGPLIHQYDAVLWGVTQATLAGLCLAGVVIPGRPGAALLLVASLVCCVFYLFFGLAASLAAQGAIARSGALYTYFVFSCVSVIAGAGGLRRVR